MTLSRPAVDVIVPFLGASDELAALRRRLAGLRLSAGDTIVIVDNSPLGCEPAGPDVLRAPERQTPGFARNRGAARGEGEWLVFLDADVEPSAGLLDAYFEPAPAARTGLLAGGIRDEEVAADAPMAARYAYLRGAMSQDDTLRLGEWGYPKSANIACRRVAFAQVGGFREDIRAAEDADLTYRLRAAGWGLERREAAAAVHLNRATLRGLLRQKVAWGAGGGWISRVYPGSLRLARGPGLAMWLACHTVGGLVQALVRRDRDAFILAVLRPLEALAFEFGRHRSNERHG